MKTEVKYFISPDIEDLSLYNPIEEDNFCFLLQIIAAPKDMDGEESFSLTICTPKWLINNNNKDDVVIGRHYLIVFQYDWKNIESKIRKYVESCTGSNWNECALKLSRLGHWEFEDYREH